MWLQNPGKSPEVVRPGMSLRGGEGVVGERDRNGVGVYVNYLGLMFSSVVCSMLRACLLTK